MPFESMLDDLMLSVEKPDQILNMGGPYVGCLSVNGDLMSENVVLDNYVYDKEKGLLFFVKYHIVSKYHWYFTINFYNIEEKLTFQFRKEFDMVYLGELKEKSELTIYHAFHGAFPKTRIFFDLDKEDMKLIN